MVTSHAGAGGELEYEMQIAVSNGMFRKWYLSRFEGYKIASQEIWRRTYQSYS